MSAPVRITASADVAGVVKQLQALRGAGRKVCRKAVTKGGQVFVKEAKAKCPVRDTGAALRSAGVRKVGPASFVELKDRKGLERVVKVSYKGGLLKKAQGYKVKSYRGRGVSVAVCGTRSGFRQQIGVRTSGKHAGEAIYADPRKYAHLVIKGTRHSSPQDFHTPASRSAAKAAAEELSAQTDKAIAEAARS
jgi:hypothetical protein